MTIRAATYNVAGRVAIASFPALAPMCVYWGYGQDAMLLVAQGFNLTSYTALLGLAGFVLPLRDFRTYRRTASLLEAHYAAYLIFAFCQLTFASALLLGLESIAPQIAPSIADKSGFEYIFWGLGAAQVATLVSAGWTGWLLAHDEHLLTNTLLIGTRVIALGAAVYGALTGLAVQRVALVWIVVFSALPLVLWIVVHRKYVVRITVPFTGVVQALKSITRRSFVFGYWSLMMLMFYAVPLTYISYRWPAEFGGMNYAFLLGSGTTTVVTAWLIPKANEIQDRLGEPVAVDSLHRLAWIAGILAFFGLCAALTVSWPIHALVVGQENTQAFRLAAPLILIMTTLRLLTWATTQCAIAIGMEHTLITAPLLESCLALIATFFLSHALGAIGVPLGLIAASAARLFFTYAVDLPRIKAAWNNHRAEAGASSKV